MKNLYNESLNNGLDIWCYKNLITVLKEYCVRMNELYIGRKYVSSDIYSNKLNSYIEKGFNHLPELIEIIDKKDNYYNYEEFFKNEVVSYFVNLNKMLSSKLK